MKEMFGEDYSADRTLWKQAATALLSYSRSLDPNQPSQEHQRRACAALVALTPGTEPEWWAADVEEAAEKLMEVD